MKALLTFHFAQAGTLSVPCAAGSVHLRGLQNGKERPEPQAHIKAHFIRSRFQCKKRKKNFCSDKSRKEAISFHLA